jgi:4-methyl-5(b-hydroxyethyl)-thiazole monophosphate biosynthesis
MSKVYVFLAEGFEEIEGLTVVDLLRRANISTEMVSIGEVLVKGSHGILVTADGLFEDYDYADAELLVLPGGMPGTLNLGNHEGLCTLLKKHFAQGKKVAAICAAPSVLGKLGILEGKKATCYPGFEDQLTGAVLSEEKAVVDGTVITGKGMGAAIEFSLALIAQLVDQETAEKIGKAIIY